METLKKGAETFLIGLMVVITSAILQALINYHPTGISGTLWAILGVAIIGGFRALLSWLIVKQNTTIAGDVSKVSSASPTSIPIEEPKK